MKRYVDYLATQDSAYILKQGLGDWYDFGAGRAGFAQNTPMPLVSTAHYYWLNKLMGEPRADSIKAAFIREFYHPKTHQFGTGSQCANAIALEMDLVPEGDREAVLQNLISDIHQHGNRLTTGDVGNRYLFNALIHALDGTREDPRMKSSETLFLTPFKPNFFVHRLSLLSVRNRPSAPDVSTLRTA
jgi:hypothetical protein